ncbi:CRISPR-associated helicase Cas3' [Paenibacillus wenxiniae]|uniref:CRISPR-associated helicase Cas3 n=1 Tax=Paenibacillus wenxiniae TaxID=1636843 RepID=A0ABW4RE41_9BACL
MLFYAKSKPAWPNTETIKQHTEALVRCYHILKQHYQHKLIWMSERDWQLLYWAVMYHDVGKYDAVFQNKILQVIRQPLLEVKHLHPIRHNYISVLAIPYKELGLSKDEESVLIQAVGYHHEGTTITGIADFNQHVAAAYKLHILPHADQIEQELGIKLNRKISTGKLSALQHVNRFKGSKNPWFYKYIMIKGLLHRLDHAASAHVDVELAAEMAVGEYTSHFIEHKMIIPYANTVMPAQKNALQRFAEQHQNQHIVVVAQTGMGKTEAGLLWIGEDKGFFTLPLRVSINSMYNRVIDKEGIAFTTRSEGQESIEEATGLLHSTTLDHLQQLMDADEEALEKTHRQSAQYANKLIISTIDQVLKFPLFYLGFEKEYATMAYSKIIIDELQAYDPRIAAVIVQALVMIDQIGGSFMIMTATLPPFYYTALQKKLACNQPLLQDDDSEQQPRPALVYGEYIDDTIVRHHVQIRSESIVDEATIQRIVQDGKQSKVLVICNTVKRAVEVYRELQKHMDQPHLLHSRLIKRDRALREKDIITFAKHEQNAGIWITTQLVEASLDIDFDILHTEMSSLDSQFQRYGRCNRKGLKSVEAINIWVYTAYVSGVNIGKNSIYHEDIYARSLELFGTFQTGILSETAKHRMIQLLYDEEALKESTFKQLFDHTLEQLQFRTLYETSRKQAQDLLRDIHEIQVIPECFRGNPEIEAALHDWSTAKGDYEHIARIRRKARQTLEQYTVGVNEYVAHAKKLLSPIKPLKDLYYVSVEYHEQTGLDTSIITSDTAMIV